MMNHKNRKLWRMVIALVLALAVLPLNALALTEDTLEPAPENAETTQGSYKWMYAPSSTGPWNRKEVSADEKVDEQFSAQGGNGFYWPYLTNLELARTKRLMEQVAAGEVSYTGPSIVNATGNAFHDVGVYPLNPEDYEGETFFVLLPRYHVLTDEQILSLIAAFDELGIPFDPDSLCGRNCYRNDNSEVRRISEEEEQRLETIRTLVRRGTLTRSSVPEGTIDCRIMKGSAEFMLYPYRSMTDDELTLLALHTDSRWDDDPLEIERRAMEAAHSLCPDTGSLSTWFMTGGDDYIGSPDEGKYLVTYNTALMSSTWETLDEYRAFNVEMMKEYGNEPEVSYIQVALDSSAEATVILSRKPDEWTAAAGEWARANLRIPDGNTPEEWTVVEHSASLYPEDQVKKIVELEAETPEWYIRMDMYANSLVVNSVSLFSRKWYTMDGLYPERAWNTDDYMPSDARPGYRDTVSADEKTDPQMVIRHEDYPADDDGFFLPWLTDLELARTRKLMEQAAAGKISYSGPSIVNAAGDMSVRFGVYPLNPADYDGETFYVLLPQYETLSDEQILALIAAFDELGIPFNPDSLCGRNCTRRIWVRENRPLSGEEQERYQAVLDQVRHGKITREDIPAGTADFCLDVQPEKYDNLFYLYPYRSMTDDELALQALNDEMKWDDDPEDIRRCAEEAVGSFLRVRPEMEMDSLSLGYGTEENKVYSYTAVFYCQGVEDSRITRIGVVLSKEAGREPETAFIQAWYHHDFDASWTDEEWVDAVQEWAGENLQLPDGPLPDTWTVEHGASEYDGNEIRYTDLICRTPEWTVDINRSEGAPDLWLLNLYNRSWYADR